MTINTRRVFSAFGALILIAVITQGAASASLSLRIVDGVTPIEPIGPRNLGDERVVFGDDSVHVDVGFFYGSADPRKPATGVVVLGRPFAEAIEWEIRWLGDGEAPASALRIEPVATRFRRGGVPLPLADVNEVQAGEGVTATYRFENAPLGTWSIRAKVRDADGNLVASSYAVRLIAATGNESPALRALYLREQTRRIEKRGVESFSEYAGMVTELMELQPDDPGIPERFADASIGRIPPEETMALYDRALAIADQNLSERYGSIADAPDDIARYWASRRDDLQSFRRIYPRFAARSDDFRIEVLTIDGTKRATLVDREGRPVAVVNRK